MAAALQSFRVVHSVRELQSVWGRLTSRSIVAWDVDDVLITWKDKALRRLTSPIPHHPMDGLNSYSKNDQKNLLSQIYSQAKFKISEPEILDCLQMLKEKKVLCMAITAFETPEYGIIKDTVAARLNQLQKIGVDFKDERWPKEPFSLSGDFPENPPYFKDGVLFSAPHSKGPVYRAFLKYTGLNPDQKVLLDDSVDNLHSTKKALPDTECVQYKGAFISSDAIDIAICKIQWEHFLNTKIWLDEETIECL